MKKTGPGLWIDDNGVLSAYVGLDYPADTEDRQYVEVNKYYWLGASNSPRFVKVTRAEPERFWYVEHYALDRKSVV